MAESNHIFPITKSKTKKTNKLPQNYNQKLPIITYLGRVI